MPEESQEVKVARIDENVKFIKSKMETDICPRVLAVEKGYTEVASELKSHIKEDEAATIRFWAVIGVIVPLLAFVGSVIAHFAWGI